MAGDWIKMTANLGTHPKVVRIASALNADRLRVVGGLHAVWCLFDAHSVDGSLPGYTLDAIDDLIGWPGFAAAMERVEWLKVDGDQGSILPRYDTHNGASAKRRAMEADRKREARNSPQDVRTVSASDADIKRTREEKNREEKNNVKTNTFSSEPPSASKQVTFAPALIEIDIVDGTAFGVTSEQFGEWADAYPAVDVMAELRAMRQWVRANPTKRKTRRGVLAFCNSWLMRSQDKPAQSRTVPSRRDDRQAAARTMFGPETQEVIDV